MNDRLRNISLLTITLSVFYLAGCFENFGAGGTGERVIPREKLREVHRTSLEEMSAASNPAGSPASTHPPPAPTSRPAADRIELSIEQARQWALANNLDLRV